MPRYRKIILHLSFITATFLLSGCFTLYKPNAVYSPMLKEEGELNVSALLGVSGGGLVNVQAAYAMTNHVGITADGMYHTKTFNSTDSLNLWKEKLRIVSGEVGGGYFTKIGGSGLLQCYGGGGYGFSNDRIYNDNGAPPHVSAQYYNLYLQPGIGFTTKNVELAFDLRANYVRLFDIRADQSAAFDWWDANLILDSDTALYFVNLEPAITLRAGGERLKGVLQFGATIPTVNQDEYFAVNPYSLLGWPLIKFSVGVNYMFTTKPSGEE